MNRFEVAQKVGASVTTVNRYARKHGIEKYTLDDIVALQRELEEHKLCPRRKLIMQLIREAGEAGISGADLAMKMNTSTALANASVRYMINCGFPIFDEAILIGKKKKKYRYYIDE